MIFEFEKAREHSTEGANRDFFVFDFWEVPRNQHVGRHTLLEVSFFRGGKRFVYDGSIWLREPR